MPSSEGYEDSELSPERVYRLVHRCVQLLKPQLESATPVILPLDLGHVPQEEATHFTIQALRLNNQGTAGRDLLKKHLASADKYALASILRFCWARIEGGVVSRKFYALFKEGEEAMANDKCAFYSLLAICEPSSARASLIRDFFDLLVDTVTVIKSQCEDGDPLEIVRAASWWAFDIPESSRHASFEDLYYSFTKNSQYCVHLFFAYLRALNAQYGPTALKEPLIDLLSTLPSYPPPIDKTINEEPFYKLTVGLPSGKHLGPLEPVEIAKQWAGNEKINHDEFQTTNSQDAVFQMLKKSSPMINYWCPQEKNLLDLIQSSKNVYLSSAWTWFWLCSQSIEETRSRKLITLSCSTVCLGKLKFLIEQVQERSKSNPLLLSNQTSNKRLPDKELPLPPLPPPTVGNGGSSGNHFKIPRKISASNLFHIKHGLTPLKEKSNWLNSGSPPSSSGNLEVKVKKDSELPAPPVAPKEQAVIAAKPSNNDKQAFAKMDGPLPKLPEKAIDTTGKHDKIPRGKRVASTPAQNRKSNPSLQLLPPISFTDFSDLETLIGKLETGDCNLESVFGTTPRGDYDREMALRAMRRLSMSSKRYSKNFGEKLKKQSSSGGKKNQTDSSSSEKEKDNSCPTECCDPLEAVYSAVVVDQLSQDENLRHRRQSSVASSFGAIFSTKSNTDAKIFREGITNELQDAEITENREQEAQHSEHGTPGLTDESGDDGGLIKTSSEMSVEAPGGEDLCSLHEVKESMIDVGLDLVGSYESGTNSLLSCNEDQQSARHSSVRKSISGNGEAVSRQDDEGAGLDHHRSKGLASLSKDDQGVCKSPRMEVEAYCETSNDDDIVPDMPEEKVLVQSITCEPEDDIRIIKEGEPSVVHRLSLEGLSNKRSSHSLESGPYVPTRGIENDEWSDVAKDAKVVVDMPQDANIQVQSIVYEPEDDIVKDGQSLVVNRLPMESIPDKRSSICLEPSPCGESKELRNDECPDVIKKDDIALDLPLEENIQVEREPETKIIPGDGTMTTDHTSSRAPVCEKRASLEYAPFEDFINQPTGSSPCWETRGMESDDVVKDDETVRRQEENVQVECRSSRRSDFKSRSSMEFSPNKKSSLLPGSSRWRVPEEMRCDEARDEVELDDQSDLPIKQDQQSIESYANVGAQNTTESTHRSPSMVSFDGILPSPHEQSQEPPQQQDTCSDDNIPQLDDICRHWHSIRLNIQSYASYMRENSRYNNKHYQSPTTTKSTLPCPSRLRRQLTPATIPEYWV